MANRENNMDFGHQAKEALQPAADLVSTFTEPFRARAQQDIEAQILHVKHLLKDSSNSSLSHQQQQKAAKELRATLKFINSNTFLKLPFAISSWYRAIHDTIAEAESRFDIDRDQIEAAAREGTIKTDFLRSQYLKRKPRGNIYEVRQEEINTVNIEGRNALRVVESMINQNLPGGEKMEVKKPQDILSVGDALRRQMLAQGEEEETSDTMTPPGYYLDMIFTLNTDVNGYLAHLSTHYSLDNSVVFPQVKNSRSVGPIMYACFSCRGIPLNPNPVTPEVQDRAVEIALKVPLVYSNSVKFRVLGRIFGTDWDPVWPDNLMPVTSPKFLQDFMEQKCPPAIPSHKDLPDWLIALTIPFTIAILWQMGLDRIFLTGLGGIQTMPTSINKVKKRLKSQYGIWLWDVDEALHAKNFKGDEIRNITLESPPVYSHHAPEGRILKFNLEKLNAPWGMILDENVCYWIRNNCLHPPDGRFKDLTLEAIKTIDTEVVKKGRLLENKLMPSVGYTERMPWKSEGLIPRLEPETIVVDD
ncbi:hypothetical protein MKZ38_007975 [Zalerion maritima]|uniref:Uncharacterized protein n=1 Tax=Zalerion maritima TaxID=339359 RepID=A0AAD5WMP7_9PEZI|nr:hypothetical protein MKZ38_007975 [Zalerion maritima]